MSDVTKFAIGNNTYSVKDSTARAEISEYVTATTQLINSINELIDSLPLYSYSAENITIKELGDK